MTQPTRLICAPWASLADLEALPNRPTLDDETWEDLLWQASEMLYLWSGKQYTGGCRSTVVLDVSPGGAYGDDLLWRYLEDAWAAWGYWSPWGAQDGRGVGKRLVAQLPDAPITEITSVTGPDDADVAYTAELPSGIIRRTDGHTWDAGTKISYSHGLLPPIGGMRAAVTLTVELGKSWTGAKCNLPKRVEQVTRQGLTYNMAPLDWGTGIWEIDSWLRSVNPHQLMRRASAWSPDAARLRRTTT